MLFQPGQFSSNALVNDAVSIWQYGVRAVTPKSLIQRKVHRDGHWLIIDELCEIDLHTIERLILVGAGKASAAMATEFIEQVCSGWPSSFPKISGWINAPAFSFHRDLKDIHLHAARPQGLNMPTQEALDGTAQILQMVSDATSRDLVLCMISGGGSALLVSPQPGLTLDDKQAVAQCVAAAGGNIIQLNDIRRCISQVKGGGLARACKAGRLVSLIISDVLGDPLETIASGPTVLGRQPDYAQALKILRQLGLEYHPKLQNVIHWLSHQASAVQPTTQLGSAPENFILGNLADAVDAAGVRAVELGYRYIMQVAREPEGDVAHVAQAAISNLSYLHSQTQIDCWISGGEPTVRLPPFHNGKGGRNQQLVLSVLQCLASQPASTGNDRELVFMSAGTDGEDGPTDAAGAWIDNASIERVQQMGLDPNKYLQHADAYNFFEKLGCLMKTGPTGTNVGDLRVGLSQKKS